MTQQQITEEIKRLSVAERIALIETISRGLREEMGGGGAGFAAMREAEGDEGGDAPGNVSLSRQLYGALKFDGPPPTDEEVKNIIAEYLSEKYS